MRGQAHTLEAVISSLLLLTGVIIAMQITVVTPLSASTSSQFIENQQQAEARGLLANATEDGWLRKSVLYWDDANSVYHQDGDSAGYTGKDPIPSDNEFGKMLEARFESDGIAYNVYFMYESSSDLKHRTFINSGVPTDKSVTATRTVVILDSDHLIAEDGQTQASTVGGSTFYMSDTELNSPIYKVVTVRVTVWRN